MIKINRWVYFRYLYLRWLYRHLICWHLIINILYLRLSWRGLERRRNIIWCIYMWEGNKCFKIVLHKLWDILLRFWRGGLRLILEIRRDKMLVELLDNGFNFYQEKCLMLIMLCLVLEVQVILIILHHKVMWINSIYNILNL